MKSAFFDNVPGCAGVFPVEVSPPLGSANDAVVELDVARSHSIRTTDLPAFTVLERGVGLNFRQSAVKGKALFAFTHGVSR